MSLLTSAATKQGTKSADKLRAALREKVFAGWPAEGLPLETKKILSVERGDLRLSAWEFTSQQNVPLRIYVVEDTTTNADFVELSILDEHSPPMWLHDLRAGFGVDLADEPAKTEMIQNIVSPLVSLRARLRSSHSALAFFAPRGVGLTAFSGDERALTKIRRRFMLLGQTLDGMRVWDLRRAIQAVHYVRADDKGKIELSADGSMGVNTLYAALFEPNVRQLDLTHLPKSHTKGPDYLGVLQIWDIPQAVELEAERATILLDSKKQ